MISPLFPKIASGIGQTMRVTYTEPSAEVLADWARATLRSDSAFGSKPERDMGNGNVLEAVPAPARRLSISIRNVKEDEAELVGGVRRAEERLFAAAAPAQITYDPDNITGEPTDFADICAALTILMNRAANTIASRTRRGAGNVAFMHPASLEILETASTSGFARRNDNVLMGALPKAGEKIGRWTFAGTLNQVLRIYVSDTMARDEIIVAYVGSEIDAPGILFDREDGLALYVLPNDKDALANASDYMQRIVVKQPTICKWCGK